MYIANGYADEAYTPSDHLRFSFAISFFKTGFPPSRIGGMLPVVMLSLAALHTLSDPTRLSSQQCQRTLLLLADYDLALPKKLWPAQIDQRYQWNEGYCRRLLLHLVDAGILLNLTRPSHPAASLSMKLAADAMWSPKELAARWQEDLKARERVELSVS
jgi:hypothetical protein